MLTPQQEPTPGAEPPSSAGGGSASPADHRWLAEHAKRAVAGHSVGDDALVADALHSLCASARHAGVPIERVLIQLKQLWQTRTDDAPIRAGPADDRLARLVSACISIYYDHG